MSMRKARAIPVAIFFATVTHAARPSIESIEALLASNETMEDGMFTSLEAMTKRSIDFREIAVPAEPVLEARGTSHAVLDQRLAAVVPLLYQAVANR